MQCSLDSSRGREPWPNPKFKPLAIGTWNITFLEGVGTWACAGGRDFWAHFHSQHGFWGHFPVPLGFSLLLVSTGWIAAQCFRPSWSPWEGCQVDLNQSGVFLLDLTNIIFTHKGGHPGPEVNDWLCCLLIWLPAVCFGHSGKERCWAATQPPHGGELNSLAAEKTIQAWQTLTYCEVCWENLA